MTTPSTWTIGRFDLVPAEVADKDIRGIVCMWEPPLRGARYVMGVDPTVGIPGWNRSMRTRDDLRTDNAAIEVIRVGSPDVQVCEYAAPIDAEELAAIANVIGRTYSSLVDGENEPAHCIIEVQPGMGLITQREMISKFGYRNMFVWRYEDSLLPRATTKLGWYSGRDTRKALWIRGVRHIQRGKARVLSPWLVEEMADCTPDSFLAPTGRASGFGIHDDRVVAYLLATWAAHEWAMSFEPEEERPVDAAKPVNAQALDLSVAAVAEANDEWIASLLEG